MTTMDMIKLTCTTDDKPIWLRAAFIESVWWKTDYEDDDGYFRGDGTIVQMTGPDASFHVRERPEQVLELMALALRGRT